MNHKTELLMTDFAAVLCVFLIGSMVVLGGTAWGKNRYVNQHHSNN